jgi:hypothetical protein
MNGKKCPNSLHLSNFHRTTEEEDLKIVHLYHTKARAKRAVPGLSRGCPSEEGRDEGSNGQQGVLIISRTQIESNITFHAILGM